MNLPVHRCINTTPDSSIPCSSHTTAVCWLRGHIRLRRQLSRHPCHLPRPCLQLPQVHWRPWLTLLLVQTCWSSAMQSQLPLCAVLALLLVVTWLLPVSVLAAAAAVLPATAVLPAAAAGFRYQYCLVGGLEAIVFGSIRWCVWSFRPSSPLRLPHLKCLLLLLFLVGQHQIAGPVGQLPAGALPAQHFPSSSCTPTHSSQATEHGPSALHEQQPHPLKPSVEGSMHWYVRELTSE